MRKLHDQKSKLSDPVAERTLLSCLLKYGDKVLYDISGLVKEHDFYFPENKLVFSTIKLLIEKEKVSCPDAVTITNYVTTQIDNTLPDKYQLFDYLATLAEKSVSPENIKPFLSRVAKLGLTRHLQEKLNESAALLGELPEDQSIQQIIGLAEKPISDFTTSLIHNNDTENLKDTIGDYVEYLAKVQPKNMGIPTGMPLYDNALGGGLVKPGVHLIGARPGQQKSMLAINVGKHTTDLKVPTLYLDTELTKEITINRLLARETGLPINVIARGEFANNKESAAKVAEARKRVEEKNFYYHNISGLSHHEWISIIKRWLIRHVGFNKSGKVNDCLVILDYIKMMDLTVLKGDTKEYQYLGQVITDLHNLTVQYDFSILSMVQLNRDGIDGEDDSVIADSDRLLRLCSSFTIMKKKSEADYPADPPTNGNRKLIVVKSRFGPISQQGEYINLKADPSRAYIAEGKMNTDGRGEKMVVLEPEENGIPI